MSITGATEFNATLGSGKLYGKDCLCLKVQLDPDIPECIKEVFLDNAEVAIILKMQKAA